MVKKGSCTREISVGAGAVVEARVCAAEAEEAVAKEAAACQP